LVKLDSMGCDSVGCPQYYTALQQPTAAATQYIISAYPNPAKDKITIALMLPEEPGKFALQVTDNVGRLITVVQLNKGYSNEVIETGRLAQGLYFYSLTKDNGVLQTGKFIKQ